MLEVRCLFDECQANIAQKGVSPRHTLSLDGFNLIKCNVKEVSPVIIDSSS